MVDGLPAYAGLVAAAIIIGALWLLISQTVGIFVG